MKNSVANIYKRARIGSGLTQERAAEALNVSTRTLIDYEAGKRIPPDDVVCAMTLVYGSRPLGYLHLKQNSEVGRKYLPDINFEDMNDLPKAVLRLQKETSDLYNVENDMIAIAYEGISLHSQERWEDIRREINDMASAALAITLGGF